MWGADDPDSLEVAVGDIGIIFGTVVGGKMRGAGVGSGELNSVILTSAGCGLGVEDSEMLIVMKSFPQI